MTVWPVCDSGAGPAFAHQPYANYALTTIVASQQKT